MNAHLLPAALGLVLITVAPLLTQAQSLRREDAGIKYPSTEVKGALDESELVSWNYFESEGKWQKRDGAYAYPCFDGNAEVYNDFNRVEVRHVIVDEDTMTVLSVKYLDGYYKYPSIKQGFTTITAWDSFIFDGHEEREEMRQFVAAVEMSSLADFTPGVETFIFRSFAGDRIGAEPSEREINNWVEKRGSSILAKDNFGLAVFPVVVDGQKSIRFLLFKDRGSGYTPDAKCFDKGYVEVPVEAFNRLLGTIE